MWGGLRNLLLVGALVVAINSVGSARAGDPVVPPGLDPGGTAIALVTTGIDYRDPLIASRLARDGEGQLIGWDFVDNDATPFAVDPGATALAKLLLDTDKKARLVVVRVNPENGEQLVRAAAFIARTPARIATVPFASTNQKTWALFIEVARKSPRTLFVFSAGNVEDIISATPIWPAAARLPNSVNAAPVEPFLSMMQEGGVEFAQVDAWIDAWVGPNSISEDFFFGGSQYGPPNSSAEAAVVVAALAGCVIRAQPDIRTGKELRAALMVRRPSAGPAKINESRVLEPFCRN